MDPRLFFEQNRGTFFDDRAAAAEYIRTNCKEDLDHVLHIADLAVENKFLFQLRWDLEQTVVPETFDGAIDWLRQPGDDRQSGGKLCRTRAQGGHGPDSPRHRQ